MEKETSNLVGEGCYNWANLFLDQYGYSQGSHEKLLQINCLRKSERNKIELYKLFQNVRVVGNASNLDSKYLILLYLWKPKWWIRFIHRQWWEQLRWIGNGFRLEKWTRIKKEASLNDRVE